MLIVHVDTQTNTQRFAISSNRSVNQTLDSVFFAQMLQHPGYCSQHNVLYGSLWT